MRPANISRAGGMAYRVELDCFCGPMDLLLYLVRRQELDILDLPIAKIAEQFLEFLDVLQTLDFDLVGDFLVVASALVEIKSRTALPQPEEAPVMVEVVEDPRADLVRQLLEYKRFREAAKALEDQSAEWQQRYPRLSDDRPRLGNNPADDLIKEVELWDLVSALSRVLKRHSAHAPKAIIYDDTPISTYIEQIKQRVLAEGKVAFSALFQENFSRSKITGIFLAILEILRHHHFRAEQPDAYSEIWVLPPAEASALPLDASQADTAQADAATAPAIPPSAIPAPHFLTQPDDDPLAAEIDRIAVDLEPDAA
jgi:segregation and condensation protein A